METLDKPVRLSFLKAFAPFWITSAISLIIACTVYHQRHAPFTRLQMHVTVDGEEPEDGFFLSVNGVPWQLDRAVSLGPKTIIVATDFSESFTTNHFVWYGQNPLGNIKLRRSKLDFTLNTKPKAQSIQLQGDRGTFTSMNGSFDHLPAGRYQATLSYGEHRDVHQVRLTSHFGKQVELLARIGSASLSSDPADGRFELRSINTDKSWAGSFPQDFQWLPAGSYRLTARRGDYRREIPLSILPNETNQTLVKFTYKTVEFATVPDGATVYLGDIERGTTPITVTNVIPGTYQVRLTKDKFETEYFELKVAEDGVAQVSRTLRNSRYVRSMAAARTAVQIHSYLQAVKELTAALEEQPNDPDAIAMMNTIRPAALKERVLALIHSGQFKEATSTLEELTQLEPNSPEIEPLKTKLAEAKARNEKELADTAARQARQREEEQIRQRKHEIDEAFVAMQKPEGNPNGFPSASWTTSKSFDQVRSAFEAISKAGKEGKMSDLVLVNDHLATLKLGGGLPALGLGRYSRNVICELAPGQTAIRTKVFNISIMEINIGAYDEMARLKAHLERLRVALAAALDGDLK